jgi:hypothetical protein
MDDQLRVVVKSLVLEGSRADPAWIEVGVLLARGKSNPEIASLRRIGKRTTSTYISKLCAVTGCRGWRELSGKIIASLAD